jgi:hypothetical protein
LGLRYKIVYKPGKENAAADADALSRRIEDAELLVTTVCVPRWLDRVLQSYINDPAVQELLRKIELQSLSSWSRRV